jgi:hypothetical protein
VQAGEKRGGLRVETCFSARKNFCLYAYNLKTELLAVYPKSLFLQPKALFLQTEILFIDFVCKIRFLRHRKMTFIRGQEETRKQTGKR